MKYFILAILLLLGWSEWAEARDILVTPCETIYPPTPKPLTIKGEAL